MHSQQIPTFLKQIIIIIIVSVITFLFNLEGFMVFKGEILHRKEINKNSMLSVGATQHRHLGIGYTYF